MPSRRFPTGSSGQVFQELAAIQYETNKIPPELIKHLAANINLDISNPQDMIDYSKFMNSIVQKA
ncbi:hypothetical protein CXB36_22760 [Pseudomonas syringae pv. syringae]|nr:hypothetical protein BKC06_020340 [Pseudomonas syringae pv. syringae]PHN16408.1 hypothetical protein AO256_09985 [Pseudomonas syringae]KWS17093.1 hypothetical protein AL063_25155 [Pseudomonas syringae pv. syringae]PHX25373.1 hypothetical protein AO278_19395 [Pseudomonas syringae pv. syringae]PHX46136.1 hypothetical protein AO393_23615 [Pseudomonas syringae pv. syringae]